MTISLLFALGAAAAPAPAAPPKAAPIKTAPADPFGTLVTRVGNWQIRRNGVGICNATASFGDALSFALLLRPDRSIGIVIASSAWDYPAGSQQATVFAIGDSEYEGTAEVFREKTGQSLVSNFPAEALGAFRAARRLTLYIGDDATNPFGDATERLSFNDNVAVADALSACMGWPVAAAIATARPPAYLNRPEVITADDYPAAARRAQVQGTVRYRVAVTAEGRPSNCAILSGTGNAELDTASCTLIMRRARFSPARNERGEAVAGALEARVIWRMP